MGLAFDTFSGSESRRQQAEKQNANKPKPQVGGPNLFGHSCTPAAPEPEQRKAFIEFLTDVMRECYRVLKPGAFCLVWGLPRTAHWTATAIEDSGFLVKDCLVHVQGQGFPKGMALDKKIDERLGHKREVIGMRHDAAKLNKSVQEAPGGWVTSHRVPELTAPSSDEAKKFEGWNTALKPAAEFWILARKPLSESTIVDNVLKWGTGGLNIDACRIETTENLNGGAYAKEGKDRYDGYDSWRFKREGDAGEYKQPSGRYPANFVLQHSPLCVLKSTKKIKGISGGKESGDNALGQDSGWNKHNNRPITINRPIDADGMETIEDWECDESCPIKLIDKQSGVLTSGKDAVRSKEGAWSAGDLAHGGLGKEGDPQICYGDTGGASRFFKNFAPDPFIYQAKASRKEKSRGLDDIVKYSKDLPEDVKKFVEKEMAKLGVSVPCHKDQVPNHLKELFVPLVNHHATVKSLKLMEYLTKLICPPGGVVLDCFLGSGTTGVAALNLGFGFVGIEREEDYFDIAEYRIRSV